MSAALEVRRARPEELPACADLYVRVLRDTFTWQPPERHHREDFPQIGRDEHGGKHLMVVSDRPIPVVLDLAMGTVDLLGTEVFAAIETEQIYFRRRMRSGI